MNPISVANQIVVNRVNRTIEDAKCNSKSFDTNSPTKLPSVIPIPAGKKDIAPNNIEKK